jgi:hypothetical protein
MKVSQVSIQVDGSVTSKAVELKAFTRKCVLEHLGNPVLSPMCKIERCDDGSFLVMLAQDKAWTWIQHVFVARSA